MAPAQEEPGRRHEIEPMKATVFDRYGEPAQVLEVREVEKPEPRFRQVLVRMLAAAVNPSDLLTVEGRYAKQAKLPATPGYEGVGIVEANGGGILGRLRKGKRVAVIHHSGGTWQEYCVVPAIHVVPVPDDVPDEQAAMFFVNPITALAMIRYVLRVPRGAWVLQTAAGSALGQIVVRLGALHGFRTINVVRRREQADQLRAAGGDEWLAESDGNVWERVNQITEGKGVPFVLDAVGGETGTHAVASLSLGGRALLYGLLSGQSITVDPRHLITGSKSVAGFWLSDWLTQQSVPRLLGVFRKVRRFMSSGVVRADIAGTYDLSQIGDAARHAASNARGGKIILRIGTR